MDTPKIPSAESGTRPPAIKFATDIVSPPTSLPIVEGDVLFLNGYATPALNTLSVFIRLLRADGVIVPMLKVFNNFVGPAFFSQTIPLTEGFLLSVCILGSSQAFQRGQLFVRAAIARTMISGQQESMVLCQDYVTFLSFIGWPTGVIRDPRDGAGNLRSITGTTPAAGAEISETIPGQRRWKLKYLSFSFSASAAVANRVINFFLDDGANILWEGTLNFNHTASLSQRYSAGMQGTQYINSNSLNVLGIPVDIPMTTGFRFRTLTSNIQGADQFTAPQYLVEEWVES
jgi:hypothetical protein